MEQINTQNPIVKKQWETPKAEVISNDIVKIGDVAGAPEGNTTGGHLHTYQS